ncbi:MAG: glycoside hydrolase family 3 C-terminal domain-containing protein [Cytophagaceae bacterium]|nr:glycoside hydrolase family 3 C-terminal domain-containing protein [Cytophagaceae bacterium]MDW8456346.1 glycoside hydrolase family 3 N-terminal domain-containing protein [Cytophagaceae bacterium]
MRLFLLLFFSIFTLLSDAQLNETEIDKKVEELLTKMTLEEKVGQMTQLTIGCLLKADEKGWIRPYELDLKMLDSAIHYYKVGSIMNVAYEEFDRSGWQKIITQIQNEAMKTRLKIPVLYGVDAVHGVNFTKGATLFPQQIGMAATWNTQLVQRASEITAYELNASGIKWNFSPVLDVARTPLWPRLWETFGEDVYLASKMGQSVIAGYQGNNLNAPDRIAACLKHFMGYSMPLSGKDRTPAWIPERYLREYFLPPFEQAIKKGALSVMINSSEINGIPVHSDPYILTEILKNELKFKGFAVSDWEDIKYLYTVHRIAHNNREAVKIAINAGVDMSMVPNDFSFTRDLISLVKDGEVPMSRIDDAVRRILRVKFILGLFNKPIPEFKSYQKFGSKDHQKVALEATSESITLLKNLNNILPLDKNKKILVTGVGANSLNVLNGGWTHTWLGRDTAWNTAGRLTILQAIQNTVGAKNVKYVKGTDFESEINIQQALDEAENVDVIIACLGENTYTENLGNIDDISLPDAQLKLVTELSRLNKPIILVLTQGRPRLINKIEPLAAAILMAYLPGDFGGEAIGKIIFGEINPSGKLPFTYPRYPNTLLTYDHKYSDVIKGLNKTTADPQFEFGFGMSYTKFKYSDLKASTKNLTGDDTLKVFVTVTNVGNKTGKEVVQLYLYDKVASITPPVKKLKGFEKIELKPNQSKTLVFKLSKSDLSFIGRDNKPVVEDGEFDVIIDNLKETFTYKN